MESLTIIQQYESADAAMNGLDEIIREQHQLSDIIHITHSLTYSEENFMGLGKWTLTAYVIFK
jgi:hypothetical protein